MNFALLIATGLPIGVVDIWDRSGRGLGRNLGSLTTLLLDHNLHLLLLLRGLAACFIKKLLIRNQFLALPAGLESRLAQLNGQFALLLLVLLGLVALKIITSLAGGARTTLNIVLIWNTLADILPSRACHSASVCFGTNDSIAVIGVDYSRELPSSVYSSPVDEIELGVLALHWGILNLPARHFRFVRRHALVGEIIRVNTGDVCGRFLILALLLVADLLLEAVVASDAKMICCWVDRTFGTETTIGGVLRPRSGEARVYRRLRDTTDRFVLGVVDLMMTALEDTCRIKVGRMVFATATGKRLLSASRQFNHGATTIKVVFARTSWHLSALVTVCY